MNEGCCFAGNFVGTSLMPMLLKLDDSPKSVREEMRCGEINGVRRECIKSWDQIILCRC